MKTNFHKRLMYDYKYGTSNGVHQEIEQIKKLQLENEKSSKGKKINGFLQRVTFKKKKVENLEYTEVEFLGI